MLSDEDRAKLSFELANKNAQSIGLAQAKYVTALLTYIGLVWGLFFLGDTQISIHLGGVDLPVEGIWKITPVVTLVLTLAYIGTVTAMTPAFSALSEAQGNLLGLQDYSLFSLDTHKNILDYLAILQLRPSTKTRTPTDDGGPKPWWDRLHHLILPLLFVASALTSYWAIRRLTERGPIDSPSLTIGWICLAVQVAYSLRPIWRNLRRFSGVTRDHNVYN
jgi:hypothetical protein